MESLPCQVIGVYLAVHELGVAPVVLLTTPDNRYLPIFIGFYEAVSISNALNGSTPVRPLTHDLFNDTLLALNTTLRDVRVDSIEDGVYYATMTLKTHSGELSIDCRPSDGIALAVRQKSPVMLCEDLLNGSAISREQLPELRNFDDYFG
jgi:hypothetical protein